MRNKKTGLVDAKERHDIIVLQNIPQNHELVKANRFLLLLASSLMVLIFVMGFLLLPVDDARDSFKSTNQPGNSMAYNIQNPVLSAEIDILKGQLVGLISGSIESKLRMLEESIRSGRINASLGTIQDLRNDLKVLQTYSRSERQEVKNQLNEEVLKEVSQLKNLIYLTLTSCGLMIAAIAGFWVRKHYHLGQSTSVHKLGNSE